MRRTVASNGQPTERLAGDAPISTAAETPLSVLVLLGDRVLKFRKPVRTDFCDFSSLTLRLRDCEREVDLNRRLCDDVYLGVGQLELSRTAGDPTDAAAEPCVVMRRLPAGRLLSRLVEGSSDLVPELNAVAFRLAEFHASTERSVQISAAALPEAQHTIWNAATSALQPFVGPVLSGETLTTVRRLSAAWVAGRSRLFYDRARYGYVCDGHGDLRTDNIFCLDDGPRILDCVEFDDRLRHVDVATDVAFLAMDLRRQGRVDAARSLLLDYEDFSGHPVPRPLFEHSVAYWALVRAKVACLRWEQGEASAAQEAVDLLDMAHDQLVLHRPKLVLVGGLPGSGKSTVADGLGLSNDWLVLSSDRVRKELNGMSGVGPRPVPVGEGMYSPAAVDAVYGELLDRARVALQHGETVVLDASWGSATHRGSARALAEETTSELREVRCTVDHETARERLRRRVATGSDASDADAAVADALARTAVSWETATTVDTSGSASATLDRVSEMLRAARTR